ncbi:MAG: DNA gyrase subunit A [Candidatus Bipolaricaulia bacterium]
MERVELTYIEDEMRESYINYAMSVILGRAIPDVRDGLKPVQRRILYGMYKLGLGSDKPHRKAARIVGEVMGKFHPHGDQAIYDALVNMAQAFAFRYPLIDGQGNFGSIDGDEPAAMRYTEARLSAISEELLAEIEEETVDFGPNFDDSLEEPLVLPARLPNLLLNGSWGIAVGMTTQIPPHNLGEIIDGLIHLLKNPTAPLEELMRFIKGPDFPTGGLILGREGVLQAYRTGSGQITVRARAEVEEDRIIVTEIPYQVRKSTLLEAIARKVRDGELAEIADLRDESDRAGLRIVIELKRGANPKAALTKLYKSTPLEWTFGANFLVIVSGQPRRLSLVELLEQFLAFRRGVVRRRTEHRLREAERRAHILAGFLRALERRAEVLEWISAAKDPEAAQARLEKELGLSPLQAEEILKLRLRSFTALEREKLAEEFAEKERMIAEYREILGDPARLDRVIEAELLEIKERYSDPRRTELVLDLEEPTPLELEELIPDEDLLVTITEQGYVNAPREDLYRKQNRGGKGVIGMRLREGDRLRGIFTANSRDWVLFFTDAHKVYKLRAFQLPSLRRDARGENLRGSLELAHNERIVALLPLEVLDPQDRRYCLLATALGMVICNPLRNFYGAHTKGIAALRARPNDELVQVAVSTGQGEVLLGSEGGRTIRFPEKEIRLSARPSKGVIGMRLEPEDRVVGLVLLKPGEEEEGLLLLVTEKGFGKRTPLAEFPRQGRGGKGILGIKVSPRTGKVVALERVKEGDELLITTTLGKTIRIAADSIRIVSRYAQGVKLIDLEPGDTVASVVKV